MRQLPTRAHKQFVEKILNHPDLSKQLKGKNFRVLAMQSREKLNNKHRVVEPLGCNVIIYNYTDNQALQVSSTWPDCEKTKVKKLKYPPLPTHDEFQEAVKILQRDKQFGPHLKAKHLLPYRPMPPLLEDEKGKPLAERILNIGLLSNSPELAHSIVSVNLSRNEIVPREGPPPRIVATAAVCPENLPPNADCTPISRQITTPLTIQWPDTSPVWQFEVFTPRGSSGTTNNGSGIELRQLYYKGKRILAQAHVPILNVKYIDNLCGPFRDWLNEETCFQAIGTAVPGHPEFRRCTMPPQTICESGADAGNFTGVAIFEEGDELVLISECEAGWYRYIPEWRLHKDGSIRPRFKFSAISDPCVCYKHIHHAYWRLDFALNAPGIPDNHIVEYFDGTNWKTIRNETKQYRDSAHQKWRVTNAVTGDAYEVIPGAEDGTAKGDDYGKGDIWVLCWHPNEIDDGVTSHVASEAKLDDFVNDESVYREDIVFWYAAHFQHEVSPTEAPECHVVGPTLRPTNIS
jgi:hypothetical protein